MLNSNLKIGNFGEKINKKCKIIRRGSNSRKKSSLAVQKVSFGTKINTIKL